jgi:uncharacterized protein YndB with AHSA1/START domain
MNGTTEGRGADPVRRSVVVPADPARAFRRFTEEIASWWPLATHSVGEGRSETVAFECREGGRIYERTADGERVPWGTVTRWEPSRRVAFTWHPGEAPSDPTDVDVRFSQVEGGTLVELDHSGWERLGAGWEERRRDYDSGWKGVLARYAESVGGDAGSGALDAGPVRPD